MKPERFCRQLRASQQAKKHKERIVNQLASLPPSANFFPLATGKPSDALFRIYPSQANLQRVSTTRLQKSNNITPQVSGRLSQHKQLTKKPHPLQKAELKAEDNPQTKRLLSTWKVLGTDCSSSSQVNTPFHSERNFVAIQNTRGGPFASTPAILKKEKAFSQYQMRFDQEKVKMQKKVCCKIAMRKNCGFPFGSHSKREKENFLEGSGMSAIRSAREDFISAQSFLELVSP